MQCNSDSKFFSEFLEGDIPNNIQSLLPDLQSGISGDHKYDMTWLEPRYHMGCQGWNIASDRASIKHTVLTPYSQHRFSKWHILWVIWERLYNFIFIFIKFTKYLHIPYFYSSPLNLYNRSILQVLKPKDTSENGPKGKKKSLESSKVRMWYKVIFLYSY